MKKILKYRRNLADTVGHERTRNNAGWGTVRLQGSNGLLPNPARTASSPNCRRLRPRVTA